jgi:hypothetical protein
MVTPEGQKSLGNVVLAPGCVSSCGIGYKHG